MGYKYPIGDCSRHNNDAFIWIPKNGSSTLRSIFGSTIHNYNDFDVDTYWVILRDPVDRWKSGVAEYIYRNPEKEQKVFDYIHLLRFDGHGLPQTTYLQYTGRTKYIDIEDPDWVTNIINTTGIQINTSDLYDNSTKSKPRKVEITNKLEDIITDSLIDEVKEYYRADIELIDRVKGSSK